MKLLHILVQYILPRDAMRSADYAVARCMSVPVEILPYRLCKNENGAAARW